MLTFLSFQIRADFLINAAKKKLVNLIFEWKLDINTKKLWFMTKSSIFHFTRHVTQIKKWEFLYLLRKTLFKYAEMPECNKYFLIKGKSIYVLSIPFLGYFTHSALSLILITISKNFCLFYRFFTESKQ